MPALGIPSSSENVTPLWLSEALGVKISTEGFHKEDNIQAGTGFLSNMIRVQCQSEDKSKLFHLIVKLLPENDQMLGIVVADGLDRTEISFYRKLVPDLIEICPELEGYLCPTYNGLFQEGSDPSVDGPRASVLIMEDLKPQGYHTINFAQEESDAQVIEVLEFQAKFHAASLALENKRKEKLPCLYDFIQFTPEKKESPALYDMFHNGFDGVIQTLSLHKVTEDVIEKYASLIPYSDKIIEETDKTGKLHPTLIHGDLWSNNLLFNDCDNPNCHTKVIDWQLLEYKDPSYDTMICIINSIPEAQLEIATIEKHLQHYYKTFLACCEKLGCRQLLTRDWDEFRVFAKTWGLAYTLMWFVISPPDAFSSNTARYVKIMKFLAKEAKVPEFLLSVFKTSSQ